MPRASPAPRPSGRSVASGFAADDWSLLVQLPAEIMITTVAAQDGAAGGAGGPRRTVAEGLAGLDAIAAGRASDSDLVRAVVAAIYAEPEPEPEEARPYLADRDRTLADCRRAAGILQTSVDPADAAAYRHWVQQVAVRVCRAAQSGGGRTLGAGVDGEAGRPGRAPPGTAERTLLDDLAAALGR